jgi:hypothetical protein
VSMTTTVVASHDGDMADHDPHGRAGEGLARSTSWRSWPSTTGLLSPVTRGRCCAAKACTPPTSWNGVEPGWPGRWPAWPGRAAPASAPQSRSSWNASVAATSVWKPSWPAPERRWRLWESTRALGTALRERGLRAAVEQVIEPAIAELAPLVHTSGRACCSASHARPLPATPTPPERTDPAAAKPAERTQPDRTPTGPGRAARTTVLRPATRAGLGPAAGRRGLPCLDLDHVPAAACPRGEPGPAPTAHPSRPGQAAAGRHPTQRRLELGFTKLPGPDRGSFFDLYVILDIYSRYAPGWLVAPGESAELAEAFIADTIARVGVAPASCMPTAAPR